MIAGVVYDLYIHTRFSVNGNLEMIQNLFSQNSSVNLHWV